MDFSQTISLSDLLHKLASYFLLFPKTFYKVISSPHWIPGYVEAELDKKQADRFDSHVSPAFFWLIIGVFSYFISLEILVQGFSDDALVKAFDTLDTFAIITGFVFLFIPVPVSFACVLHLMKYKSIETSSFKRSFFIQCYCTAPLQLFYLSAFFITETDSLLNLLGLILLAGFGWFIYCEISIIRKELNAGLPKIIGILILMWISLWVNMLIGTGIFVAINIKTIRMLVDTLLPKV